MYDSPMSSPILIFEKALTAAPQPDAIPETSICTYQSGMEHDWVALHANAFSDSPVPFRALTADDFRKSFSERSTWNPNWMWFTNDNATGTVTGAVYLTVISPDEDSTNDIGIVHWLMVDKNERTHGLGKFLMQTLEATCFNESNARKIRVECHRKWEAAVEFYKACGYEVRNS